MAYGLKYINSFSCEDGSFARLEIHELDYTGLTKQITLASEPVTIRRGAQNQNKYVAIIGSSLTINIISEYSLQWAEFFTSNDKQFRVDFFLNENLYWTGFVQTDIYQEPYVKGRFVIQVTANDGLANLKNVNYDASVMTTVNDGYNITIDEWLRQNLAELELFNYGGYDFYIYEAVDLALDNAPADTSPLTYLHFLYNAKDGQPIYDILQGLVDSFACRIFQKNGIFYILPIDLIFAGEIVYRLRVDDSGALDATYTEVTQNVEKRFGRELTWIENDQVLEIVPAFKEVSITNNADVPLIIDSPMSADDWSDGTTLIDWTTTGTFQTIRQLDQFSTDGTEYYLKSEVNQDQIALSKRVGIGQASTWRFEFEYFVKTLFDFDYDQSTDNWRVEFQLVSKIFNTPPLFAESVEESDNSLLPTLYFNEWLIRDAFTINVVVTKSDVLDVKSLNKWIKVSFNFHPLKNEQFWGGDYPDRFYTDLELRFYGLQADASASDVQEVYYRNFKVSYQDDTSYPIKTYTSTETNSSDVTNNFAKTIMFDSRQADFSDDVFAMQFYNDANKLAFKNNDNEFIDAGKFYQSATYSAFLSQLVSFRISNNYTVPSIKINGSLRGQIDMDSMVYDPNFPTKKFMVNFIEESVKSARKQIEIIEIFEPL